MDKNHNQTGKTQNQSWISNDLESIVDLLAVTVAAGRDKRAAQVKSAAGVLDNIQSGVAQPLTNSINSGLGQIGAGSSPELSKHLAWGLLGAGAGGALGLGSQLMAPEHKKRPLSSFLTGSLLGAGVGASGSLLHSNWDELFKKDQEPPTPDRLKRLTGLGEKGLDLPLVGQTHRDSLLLGGAGVAGMGAADIAGSVAGRHQQHAQNLVRLMGKAKDGLPANLTSRPGLIPYLRDVVTTHGSGGMTNVLTGNSPNMPGHSVGMAGVPENLREFSRENPNQRLGGFWRGLIGPIGGGNYRNGMGGLRYMPRVGGYLGAAAIPALLNEWLRHPPAPLAGSVPPLAGAIPPAGGR